MSDDVPYNMDEALERMEHPDMEVPELGFDFPDMELSDIESPDMEFPDIVSPDIASPDMEQSVDQDDQRPEEEQPIDITYVILWGMLNGAILDTDSLGEGCNIHISDPTRYASSSETPSNSMGSNNASNANDERSQSPEHIEPIPCSAMLVYKPYWAYFRCKLNLATRTPLDFVRVEGGDPMIERCGIRYCGIDDRGADLLRGTLVAVEHGEEHRHVFWCKQVFGDQWWYLTDGEEQFVWAYEAAQDEDWLP